MSGNQVQSCFDEILHDASSNNSLVVLGRGLGMARVFAMLVAKHVQESGLVIGVNISRTCAFQLIWPAIDAYSNSSPSMKSRLLIPRFISADYSVNDRKLLYDQGGFLVVTSNVLVHDFLHSTIPSTRISGIVVFAAENIREGTNDHFALKLFRSQNRSGFVMAFSEAPTRLTGGFHNLEKLIHRMYLSRVCLWPRFHRSIKAAFRGRMPDFVNLSIDVSPKMAALLLALRDVVRAVCTDLSNSSKLVDISDVFSDGAKDSRKLRTNFDTIVNRQVEELNERVGSRVRSLASDLSMLRKLINDVLELNPVLFYQKIATLRHTSPGKSSWLIRKEAQSALHIARSRVWFRRAITRQKATTSNGNSQCHPRKVHENEKSNHESKAHETKKEVIVTGLEFLPKWKALKSVITEIQEDLRSMEQSTSLQRVLVFIKDKRIRDEALAALCNDDVSFLEEQFKSVFPSVAKRVKDDSLLLEELDQRYRQTTLTQLDQDSIASIKESDHKSNTSLKTSIAHYSRKRPNIMGHGGRKYDEILDKFEGSKSSDFMVCTPRKQETEVMVWCLEWLDVQGRAGLVLSEYRPAFIISATPNVPLLRQSELFKASHPGLPVRLYILTYNDYIEAEVSDAYVSKEKDAFKNLIRERAIMATHMNQEGRQDEDEAQFLTQALSHTGTNLTEGFSTLDSRLLKKRRREDEKPSILVDVRELRSKLPMLIHKTSLVIIPLTLEVGDFILSRNIAVERKTIPDLHGSFASGRLFTQCEALSRHYNHPCLLIEFNANIKLSLSLTAGGIRPELSMTCITSKMVLLVQHFPSIHILWVRGASDAVKVFQALKEKEKEPDPKLAGSYGVDSETNSAIEFNPGPKALLRCLPGIDGSNMHNIMRQVHNIAELTEMTKPELYNLLGNQDKAGRLIDFFQRQPEHRIAHI